MGWPARESALAIGLKELSGEKLWGRDRRAALPLPISEAKHKDYQAGSNSAAQLRRLRRNFGQVLVKEMQSLTGGKEPVRHTPAPGSIFTQSSTEGKAKRTGTVWTWAWAACCG